MKITSNDICKKLEEETNTEWCFGFGYHGPDVIPCFYRKNYEGILKDSRKMITIQPQYKGFSKDYVKGYFENINWAEAYLNATNIPSRALFSSKHDKLAQKTDKNTKSILAFIMPKRIERIISNTINNSCEKVNEK